MRFRMRGSASDSSSADGRSTPLTGAEIPPQVRDAFLGKLRSQIDALVLGPVTDAVCRDYIRHMEGLICGGMLKESERIANGE